MNPLKILVITMLVLCSVCLGQVWAQTSLVEMDTAMKGMETLDSGSSGPSPQILNRVRSDLGQAPPRTTAPASAPVRAQAPSTAAPKPAPDASTSDVAEGDEAAPGGETDAGFTLSSASQYANQGITHLKAMRFNDAVEAYRQAKDIDARYTDFFDKTVSLRERVDAGELEQVKKERVHEEFDLTWRQFLGWDKGQGQLVSRYGYAPGLEGTGPMGPGMMGPGMMGPGMMGPPPGYRK